MQLIYLVFGLPSGLFPVGMAKGIRGVILSRGILYAHDLTNVVENSYTKKQFNVARFSNFGAQILFIRDTFSILHIFAVCSPDLQATLFWSLTIIHDHRQGKPCSFSGM